MAFTDRSVEYPGRVQLTNVSGDVYDMTRAEGDVYTEGTLLNAANLNQQTQLDSAVQTKFAAVETDTSAQNDMSNALNYLLESYTPITSGNWTYIRLGNIFIGSYRTTLNLSITNQVGQIWTCYNQNITYPITLSAVYYANVTASTSSYNLWSAVMSSSTSGVAFRVMSTASRAATDYPIKCFVFGKV